MSGERMRHRRARATAHLRRHRSQVVANWQRREHPGRCALLGAPGLRTSSRPSLKTRRPSRSRHACHSLPRVRFALEGPSFPRHRSPPKPLSGGERAPLHSLHHLRPGSGKASHVAEPSVAKNAQYVLETYNWGAAVSTNGGGSFQFVDPKKALPNDYGGFCCDQLALYEPSRKLWIWVLQYKSDQAGNNAIRVWPSPAAMPPLPPAGSTTGTTPQQLAASGDGVSYDSPRSRAAATTCTCRSRPTPRPPSSPRASFCASRSTRSLERRPELQRLRHFDLQPRSDPGAAGTDVLPTMRARPRCACSAARKRRREWSDEQGPHRARRLGHPALLVPTERWFCQFGLVPGLARRNDGLARHSYQRRLDRPRGTIGFSWDAPQGTGGFGSFPFPYVHTVRIAESTRRVIDEPLLWSSTFAYQYAVIAPNSNGDLGGTVMYGGGSQFENCAVVVHDSSTSGGFFDVASAATSSADPVRAASGDYLTARPDPARGGGWIGTCYTVRGAGENKDVHPYFLAFGRAGGPPPPLPPPGDRKAPSVTAHPASIKHGTNGTSASSSPTTAAKQRSPPAYTQGPTASPTWAARS